MAYKGPIYINPKKPTLYKCLVSIHYVGGANYDLLIQVLTSIYKVQGFGMNSLKKYIKDGYIEIIEPDDFALENCQPHEGCPFICLTDKGKDYLCSNGYNIFLEQTAEEREPDILGEE